MLNSAAALAGDVRKLLNSRSRIIRRHLRRATHGRFKRRIRDGLLKPLIIGLGLTGGGKRGGGIHRSGERVVFGLFRERRWRRVKSRGIGKTRRRFGVRSGIWKRGFCRKKLLNVYPFNNLEAFKGGGRLAA